MYIIVVIYNIVFVLFFFILYFFIIYFVLGHIFNFWCPRSMMQIIILLQQIESCENRLNTIEMFLRSIVFRVEYAMLLEKYPKQICLSFKLLNQSM